MNLPELHCLVPDLETAKKVIAGGTPLIQYRNKNFSSEHYEELREIIALCKENNVVCIINDFPEVALKFDADGVHLGVSDTPLEKVVKYFPEEKMLGFTVHNLEELAFAHKFRERISYIGVGSVFPSPTKKVKVLGLKKFKHICELSKIPVIGIGGISLQNMCSVFDAGAYGVAVISAFARSNNVSDAVARLKTRIAECKRSPDS